MDEVLPADDLDDDRRKSESQVQVHRTLFQLKKVKDEQDSSALNSIFGRYLPRVQRMVASRLGLRLSRIADVDDIVQETVTAAFASLRDDKVEFHTDGALHDWLATIVMNKVRDAFRRSSASKRDERRNVSLETESDDGGNAEPPGMAPSPSQVLRHKELEVQWESALLDLSDYHREAINPPGQRRHVVRRNRREARHQDEGRGTHALQPRHAQSARQLAALARRILNRCLAERTLRRPSRRVSSRRPRLP